jgi:hypothetical protein
VNKAARYCDEREVPRSRGDTSNPIDGTRRGLPIPRGRKDLEVDCRPHPSLPIRSLVGGAMRMPPTPSPLWGPALAGPRHRRDGGDVTGIMKARITVPNRREILSLFWCGPGMGCRKWQSAMTNRPA